MGFLVAIEGIDGSGKGTQARLLIDRLEAAGVRATLISFPRYDATFFGKAVGEFLNGRFGALDQVHPFLVSLLFAGDRYESRTLVSQSLDSEAIVVLDRYVASNVAHQAAKLDGAERDALRHAIEHLEFNIFSMTPPDATILLDLSAATAQKLIALKPRRGYTERAADLQESDAGYLARVRELYLEMAETDPLWSIVRCEQGEAMRRIDDIAEEIWRIIESRQASRLQ